MIAYYDNYNTSLRVAIGNMSEPMKRAGDVAAESREDDDFVLTVFPEPSQLGRTQIRFRTPVGSIADLSVFNAAGERIRMVPRPTVVEGVGLTSWDGRDDSGARVTPGIYFVRLKANEAERVERVTLFR